MCIDISEKITGVSIGKKQDSLSELIAGLKINLHNEQIFEYTGFKSIENFTVSEYLLVAVLEGSFLLKTGSISYYCDSENMFLLMPFQTYSAVCPAEMHLKTLSLRHCVFSLIVEQKKCFHILILIDQADIP